MHNTVLSVEFWNSVDHCLRASVPLLIVLRVVDGDEMPAMPEVAALMKHAKEKIKLSFATENKKTLLKNIIKIIETLGHTNGPSFVWSYTVFEPRKTAFSHTS